MFCVSIGTNDFKEALSVVQQCNMAEIRLDVCGFDLNQTEELFSSNNNLIATYRRSGGISNYERIISLKVAINNGAKWLDLDMIENESSFIEEMKSYAQKAEVRLILSVHNYKETPSDKEIDSYIEKAKNLGADWIKLVFYSNGEQDNLRVLNLYKKYTNIIAFNMGAKGKHTRIKSLELGAPFTYVAMESSSTAPGQMTIAEIKNIHNLKEE